MITYEEMRKLYPSFFRSLEGNYTEHQEGWNKLILMVCEYVESSTKGISMKLKDPPKGNFGPYRRTDPDEYLVDLMFTQIKEKYGSLRIYYYIDTDYDKSKFADFDTSELDERVESIADNIRGFITAMEYMSFNICEISGEAGSLCKRGMWYKTLSEKQAKANEYVPVKEEL